MSTQADDCIFGGVQTYITLKGAVLVAAVGCSRAAGGGPCVFRSRGAGHLKTDPLNTNIQSGEAPTAPCTF